MVFDEAACLTILVQKQLESLKHNKKIRTKILNILDEISLEPYSQSHKFEKLKYNYSSYCSKRLTQKNRIIYKVDGETITVIVVSILGHYDD